MSDSHAKERLILVDADGNELEVMESIVVSDTLGISGRTIHIDYRTITGEPVTCDNGDFFYCGRHYIMKPEA